MNYDGLKEDILEVIAGGEVAVDTSAFQNDVVSFASKDDALTYLIHLGYLGYNEKKSTVFIPNEEIRLEMNSAVKKKDGMSALCQIKEKSYPESIKDYTDNILLVGINYDRKTKKHECRIEKL